MEVGKRQEKTYGREVSEFNFHLFMSLYFMAFRWQTACVYVGLAERNGMAISGPYVILIRLAALGMGEQDKENTITFTSGG